MTGRTNALGLALVCALALGLAQSTGSVTGVVTDPSGAVIQNASVELSHTQTNSKKQFTTGADGRYFFGALSAGEYRLTAGAMGFKSHTQTIAVRSAALTVNIRLDVGAVSETIQVTASAPMMNTSSASMSVASSQSSRVPARGVRVRNFQFNTEQYDNFQENEFLDARRNPLSTFSADVDTASYSNIRRFLRDGELPPPDAVRIEELVNYFTYDYPEPSGGEPFSVTTAVVGCPWKPGHKLVHLGIRTARIETTRMPPANLVFLIDVSGSMNMPDKLPLVQRALHLLVDQLRPQDRVAIAVYAGAAGMALPPTPGSEKARILEAIDALTPRGSTNGAQGIRLAYQLARESFIPGGNNRVILSTDGDFNVGVSSDGELVRLIESERESGVFLSIFGFGMGNLKDSRMAKLADHGNGNYAYIDNLREARKVLVEQMSGTLLTVAKDVKMQVEFNPSRVKSYRLIGYEKRVLRPEEFNDDKKDAGDIGAGTTVTALYEVVPAGAPDDTPGVDDLRYQRSGGTTRAASTNELATIKFRYKPPDGDKSRLFSQPILDSSRTFADAGPDTRFAAAVAEYGLVLRQSRFAPGANLDHVLRVAEQSRGADPNGYRAEFIDLVKAARNLSGGLTASGRH